MIDDRTYNAFARALAEHIRLRAKGLAQDSARIVNARPQEHILAGFLTPRSPAVPPPDGSSDADIDDLPRDSAFELTAVGLEWLADREELTRLESLSVSLSLSVYIRCTPTFEEQKKYGSWRRERIGNQADMQKVQTVVPIWRRLDIPEFAVNVPVTELLRDKRQRTDITPNLQLPAMAQLSDIHSAKRAVNLTEPECETDVAFNTALNRARTQVFAPFWRGFIDVRLISVPTEPAVVRVAVRVVNDTPVPSKTQYDYLDVNLYAVRLSTLIPGRVHRPSIFQELPASFRYDRRMAGVGINSHVESHPDGSSLLLTAETVPCAETARLEAREFADADPTFAALSSNPLPVLGGIARHMRQYNATQWAAKVAALSGIERADAETSRREFHLEIDRYEQGVRLLKNPAFAFVLEAFLLMNKSMVRANKTHQRWRLFQIVFIVSLLPELASREYPALATERDGRVDLLWFAAGGGKTEAFRGIILWQAFFDRLRGKRFGNTAYVRFPLRLLTFQQLQRLAHALAAADTIRKEKRRGSKAR